MVIPGRLMEHGEVEAEYMQRDNKVIQQTFLSKGTYRDQFDPSFSEVDVVEKRD